MNISPVLSARSYSNMDPQCSNHIHDSINAVTIHSKQQSDSYDEKAKENEEEEKDSPKNIRANPSTPPDSSFAFITKKSPQTQFILRIARNDESSKEEPEEEGSITTKGVGAEYFDIFPTRRNFTYVIDFMIVEDISSIIDSRLSQVVLWRPFVKISNMTHNPPEGVVRFTNENDKVAYKMPHKIEQYNSLSNLEKEHTKLVYFRNEDDKIRGVEYVMSKILGFYKECLELGSEYLTGMDDEGEVTELLIPTSWSDESKNEKRAKRWRKKFEWKRSLFEIDLTFGINAFDLDKGTESMKDKVSQEHVCEEEVPLNNNIGKQIGDIVEMPSETVEQGMDDHVDKGRPLKRKRVYAE
ncbi:hypothetical protein Tco_1388732 [Tanacetum coccineum]